MVTYDSDGFAPYSPSGDGAPGLPIVGVQGGRVRAAVGNLLATAAPVAGDIGRLFRLPSNARINQFFIQMDDQGAASTTVDVGLYLAADDAVVDINLYGAALDGATALARLDIRHQTLNHNTMGQRVWEDAGNGIYPTADGDPDLLFTMAVTWLVVNTGIAGDISYTCLYTVD